jgi:hypothetical protein
MSDSTSQKDLLQNDDDFKQADPQHVNWP